MKEYKEFIYTHMKRLDLIPYREYCITINELKDDVHNIIREITKRGANAELTTEYFPIENPRTIIKIRAHTQKYDYTKVLLGFIETDELPEDDLAKFVRGYIDCTKEYRELTYKLMIDLYVDHVLTMEHFFNMIRFVDDDKKDSVNSLLQLRKYTGQELLDQMILWRLRN